jgi:HEAT repeat protein
MNHLLSRVVLLIFERGPGWARKYVVAQIAGQVPTVADAILPKAIRDPAPEIRTAALKILAANPGRRSAALLSQALRDTDESIREAAAGALSQYRGPLVGSRLQSALQDPHPRVRAAAAWSLGQIQTPGYSEALENVLADPEDRVRAEAAKALGTVGRSEARQLLNRLAAQDPNPRNQQVAAQSVQQIDTRFATAEEKQHRSRADAIRTLINTDLPRNRRQHAKAYLELVRDASLLPDLDQALMAARDERTRLDLMDIVAALPPSRQLQTRLLQYLHHHSSTMRRRAIIALGEVGSRDAIHYLSAARGGEDTSESIDSEDARLSKEAIARIEWRARRKGIAF